MFAIMAHTLELDIAPKIFGSGTMQTGTQRLAVGRQKTDGNELSIIDYVSIRERSIERRFSFHHLQG
jgi:hypothetical protein